MRVGSLSNTKKPLEDQRINPALRAKLVSSKPRTEAGEALAELVWTVYETYFRLKRPGDWLTAPHGQSAPRYALLRDLAFGGPATVASIAKRRVTARQAIQRVADALSAEGLAQYFENPAHRRSELLRLTPRGWKVIQKIAEDEAMAFDESAEGFVAKDLRTAARVLRAFTARIEGYEHSGERKHRARHDSSSHNSPRGKSR